MAMSSNTAMKTDAEKNRELCEKLGIEQMFAVQKGDWFYRPNSCGYTASLSDAGRYTKADAEREIVRGEPMCVIAIPLPNHFADDADGLWARHVAEKSLTEEQKGRFFNHLTHVADYPHITEYVHATAPERAHALWLALCVEYKP